MRTNSTTFIRFALCSIAFAFLSGAAFAQDQPAGPPSAPNPDVQTPPPTGGWRKVGDPAPSQPADVPPAAEAGQDQAQAPPSTPPPPPAEANPQAPPSSRSTMDPNYGQGAPAAQGQPPYGQPPSGQPSYGQPPYGQPPYGRSPYGQPPYGQPPYGQGSYGRPSYQGQGQASYNRGPIPAKLTIKPGTYVTVRLNQAVSSDRNQPGDGFSATLAKPVIVDGVVVADRGQTVGGKVVEAKKAGRVSGVSHLGVQLIDLTLADGSPAPIQTQLIAHSGPTSVGQDVAIAGTTTAAGAAIGAAADWGRGAAIGAGAGLLVGLAGVLLTRGHPTILPPEAMLTFRIEAPVTVSTEAAPQAFRWVRPGDYDRPNDRPMRAGPYGSGPGYGYAPGYGYGPYSYAYGYPSWGPGWGYWGPGLYIGGGWGWGWGGRWGGWGRGWGWRR